MDIISKLSHWYFSKKALPYWCVLLLDCTIVLCAGVAAFLLTSDDSAAFSHFVPAAVGLAVTVACASDSSTPIRASYASPHS